MVLMDILSIREHKDLRFVDDNINNVVIVDDYPPYVKTYQMHLLIKIRQYVEPHTHEAADQTDSEFGFVIEKLKVINAQ